MTNIDFEIRIPEGTFMVIVEIADMLIGEMLTEMEEYIAMAVMADITILVTVTDAPIIEKINYSLALLA